MNVNIFEKANQIIRGCDTAYFGVIDECGFPSVSAVSLIKTENIFLVHFATQKNGNKAKRLAANNRASVCFKTENCNITLVGEAELLTDQESKSRFWGLDWMPHVFPGGETDPNYVIVRFVTKRVSLWVDNEDAAFTINELLTVQSYCGWLCDSCGFKGSHGCIGCIALEGKPFWGECPVAKCCREMGYIHCGECSDIPCDALKEFSCGEGEHCDMPAGARIAVCAAWTGY